MNDVCALTRGEPRRHDAFSVPDRPTLRSLVDPHYLKLLESAVPADRIVAMEALGRVGDGRSVELLAGGLGDLDVDVTFVAAKMLGQVGTDRAIDSLIRIAVDDGCPMMRRVAATGALGELLAAPERALNALDELARGGDPWLRSAAREALGSMNARRAAGARPPGGSSGGTP
jgi:HEAT repeat protein